LHVESTTFGLHVAGAGVSDTSEIQVLSWVEAVRKRPAMYFGDVRNGTGLAHAVRFAFGGAMDQFIAGHASTIQVSVGVDGVVDAERQLHLPTSDNYIAPSEPFVVAA
jgi:aspartyl/asparaginyl-tRNA synthetase